MHVYLMCPHSRAAGGTKVICNLAQGLVDNGYEVSVVFRKYDNLDWLDEPIKFKVVVSASPSYRTMPHCDVIVNYVDGAVYGPYPEVPRILLLQGFGVHDYAVETVNLTYPFHTVVAVSQWLANVAHQVGHKNVYVIPPGIEPYFKRVDNGHVPQKKSVGTMFSNVPNKNFELFVRAMLRFGDGLPKVFVPMLAAHEPEPVKLFQGLFDKAPHKFFVNRPRKSIPSVYSVADVWVCPSLVEGFCLPAIEAMACGVPVVAVPSLGLEGTLVDHQNCLLVGNDSKEMFNAICAAIKDLTLRNRLIEQGLDTAKQFTVDRFVEKFTTVLQGVS